MSLVLWRPHSTRMMQWLLWTLEDYVSLGPRSLNPLYEAVVHSLTCAFDGVFVSGSLCHGNSVLRRSREIGSIWSKLFLCVAPGNRVSSAGGVMLRIT